MCTQYLYARQCSTARACIDTMIDASENDRRPVVTAWSCTCCVDAGVGHSSASILPLLVGPNFTRNARATNRRVVVAVWGTYIFRRCRVLRTENVRVLFTTDRTAHVLLSLELFKYVGYFSTVVTWCASRHRFLRRFQNESKNPTQHLHEPDALTFFMWSLVF